MKQAPAFQFYANDYLAGRAATYTLEEAGAYLTLLAHDWALTGLPVEPEKLARLLRVSRRKFDKLWDVIGGEFPERDGRRYNAQLELERVKQAAWREKSAKGGRANARRVVQPPLQPNTEPSGRIASPSSIAVTAKSSTARPAAPRPSSDGFERAWAMYPRRQGGNSRGDALKSWLARLAQGAQEADMLAGTERYAAWCRATGKIGTELVMQGKRFYGPGGHYAEPWDVAAARGDAAPDAAWQTVLALVPRWHRHEITADVYAELPEPVRLGLSAIGGLRRVAETPDQFRPGLQKQFAAACHSSPQRQSA